MDSKLLDCIAQMHDKNVDFAIGTVVEVVGSTSAKSGSKILIDQFGYVVTGWVGGGCAESTVCSAALDCLESRESAIVDIDMDDEVLGAGMPCGGHMRVFVEPVLAKPTVWIMGHGAVAEHLCHMASAADFVVVVNDPAATVEKFPDASRLITDDLDYRELKPQTDDSVIIATQHKGDHESVNRALNSDAKYIALIASRKRARLVMDYLREQQFSADDIQRVIAPCGIDIGAKTPVEIAISVLAEAIMLRRGGSGRQMKDIPQVRAASAGDSATLSEALGKSA